MKQPRAVWGEDRRMLTLGLCFVPSAARTHGAHARGCHHLRGKERQGRVLARGCVYLLEWRLGRMLRFFLSLLRRPIPSSTFGPTCRQRHPERLAVGSIDSRSMLGAEQGYPKGTMALPIH